MFLSVWFVCLSVSVRLCVCVFGGFGVCGVRMCVVCVIVWLCVCFV